MRYTYFSLFSLFFLCFILSSCSYHAISDETISDENGIEYAQPSSNDDGYASRIPQQVKPGEKVVIVYPTVHTWGAYDRNGELVRAGIATAGNYWCDDIQRSCQTSIGTFRIYSLGDGGCFSTIYPLPEGGGLMPYCMYFHNGQALHGSPDETVVEDNISHGCVRLRIPDAEWLRYNFVSHGTKVIIKPY